MPVFNEIARLPLIIHYPGQSKAQSKRVSALTQSIDIMPTILQHHQAAIPRHVLGKSLLPLLDGSQDKVRSDLIFGYFGMATNVTDGDHVYFRNPVNPDGGPLYEYTATPTWFEHQLMRGYWQKKRRLFSQVEMGRYFGHTYNLPLYRCPFPFSFLFWNLCSYLFYLTCKDSPLRERFLVQPTMNPLWANINYSI